MVRQWNALATGSTGQDIMGNCNTNPQRRSCLVRGSGLKDDPVTAEAEERRRELKTKILAGVKDFNVEQYRKTHEELKLIENKCIREFYEKQNLKLNDWAEVDSLVCSLADDVVDSTNPDANRDGIFDRDTPLHLTGYDLEAFLPSEEREKRSKNNRTAKRALNINMLANILLLIAKVIAVLSTHSLALIASLTDSALDLLCTVIIWTTDRLANWKKQALYMKFPAGRRRLEPLGVLVFSILMVVSFFQILQESISKLLPSGDHSTLKLPRVAIWAMVGNIVVKGPVGLYYFRFKSPQVQALVQDCKTDVYFNLCSLLFPLIGYQLDMWYLDPSGATLLSLYVIYDWAHTTLSTITRLTGAAVPAHVAKKLMYLAWRFSPVIGSYKSMTAYYLGDGIIVEVEITLDESTPLCQAHDICQTIQYCFEGLAEVDRSFVTADYSSLGLRDHAA